MSKYLGKMMVGNCAVCGGMVASMWLDKTLTRPDKAGTVGDWFLRGLKIETLVRYEGDPMPEMCTDREHRPR